MQKRWVIVSVAGAALAAGMFFTLRGGDGKTKKSEASTPFRVGKADLGCDVPGGAGVVAGDHDDADAGRVALRDRRSDLRARRILHRLEAEQRSQSKRGRSAPSL